MVYNITHGTQLCSQCKDEWNGEGSCHDEEAHARADLSGGRVDRIVDH